MRYDTIIIGGGMGGLVTGICLLRQGQRVAIVSSGQSALHFNSGSFGLYGHDGDADVVDDPLGHIRELPAEHPYTKVGIDNVARYVARVKPLFADAGITLHGDERRNHFRLTPTGAFKPAWLTMEGYASTPNPAALEWGRTLIANLQGYLDFYPQFLARGLEAAGVATELRSFALGALGHLRRSATEMRATNIARALGGEGALAELAAALNRLAGESGAEGVLLPAVVGLFDEAPVRALRDMLSVPLRMVSTIPMSVGGMRAQMRLRTWFHQHGGTYLLGDTVTGGALAGGRLREVRTANLGDMALEADNYVLATGSFLSHGLEANPEAVFEPIFGLDVVADGRRQQWADANLYGEQPFERYGVATDQTLRASRAGATVDNLYAVGAAIGGCNALREASGAGVALATAMKVADQILNSKKGGQQ